MSNTETNTVNSNVEQVDINLDEIFNAAPSGADIIQQDSKKPTNIFSGTGKKSDMSFLDPDASDADDLNVKTEDKAEEKAEEPKEEVKEEVKAEEGAETKTEENVEEILNSLDEVEETEEEPKAKRGRKTISGISDVFGKLIKDDKIVPFDDDKPLEEYTAKDWEELIEAN